MNICFVLILFVTIILIVAVISFYFLFGLTRWRLIDFFHLNIIFKKPRVKDLSKEELKKHFAYFVWVVMNKHFVVRNGCKVMEIIPMSAQQGHKYVVISKDCFPFNSNCCVTVDTDIPGMTVKATVFANGLNDYEIMMNIMGWNINEIFNNLRNISAEVEEAKEKVIDSYIDYMMREIL